MHFKIRQNLNKTYFFTKQTICLIVCFTLFLSGKMAFSSERVDNLSVEELQQFMAYRFRPITEPPLRAKQDTAEQVQLGEKLFHDVRLSKNNNISCASCHPVKNNAPGMDGLARSPGTEGKLGERNSPTVWNAAFHSMMFWDGRAKSLEEQAGMPILNAIEMGLDSEEHAVDKISNIPEYKALFAKAFPNDAAAISFNNIVGAISAFERTLIATSRYDDFAAGDLKALSDQEIRGMKIFINSDCKECHGGSTFGGNNADKLGIKHPYPNQTDLGRFNVTGESWDRMKFKVASLRNVAITAPYFHNGEVKTLEEAIKLMAWHQKGITLTPEEIDDVAAFLGALTGKVFE